MIYLNRFFTPRLSIKKMTIMAVILTVYGCGDRYNDDKKGSYGNGPILTTCRDPGQCRQNAAHAAQDIRVIDPDFETKYLDGTKLEDALAEMTSRGYLKRRSVRILKAMPAGDVMRVYLSVQNDQGEPTTDLESAKVMLKRDNRQLEFVTKEVVEASHLAVSMVMDYSGSMGPSLASLEAATIKLHQAVPQAFFSVIKFSSTAQVVAPMTRWESNAALASVIKSPFPIGSTALFDAMILGVESHRPRDVGVAAEPDRKTLNLGIVFTDGVENASNANYENAKASLRKGTIPQIILGMGEVDIKSLWTMAEDTNGLFQFVSGGDGIEAAMARVGRIMNSVILVEIPLASQEAVGLAPEEIVATFKEI